MSEVAISNTFIESHTLWLNWIETLCILCLIICTFVTLFHSPIEIPMVLPCPFGFDAEIGTSSTFILTEWLSNEYVTFSFHSFSGTRPLWSGIKREKCQFFSFLPLDKGNMPENLWKLGVIYLKKPTSLLEDYNLDLIQMIVIFNIWVKCCWYLYVLLTHSGPELR